MSFAPTAARLYRAPAMASAYLEPVSRGRRAIAVALTILVHLLIVWLLLNLGPRIYVPMADSGALSTFDVAPEATKQNTVRRRRQAQRPAAAPPPVAQPKPPIPFKDTSGVIWLTRDQFAATDITGKGHADARGDAQTADTGADSKAPYGPGEGPGGKRLYAAEWYREPTSAELNTFLPPAPPDSWGMIACRTVPEYRVEDCETLGESPLGSKIATGMRRAAWQFRVRPPRINGTPQYGAWVRIRIDFTLRGAELSR